MKFRTRNDRLLVFKVLFNHQGGSTRLNLKVFNRLIDEAPRPFWGVLITDGEIDNEEHLCDFIGEHFTPPHGFILIQLNAENKFIRAIVSKGFSVHVLQYVGELRDLILGEVKQRYGL